MNDEMNDDISSDCIEDRSFNYNNALEIAFDDESDENDEFLEEEIGNVIDYSHDQEETSSKHKQKWKEYKGESKGSENESEESESGCENCDSSGTTKKKYPMFKL